MIYRLFFKLVLQHLDPERAHRLASLSLRGITAIPPCRAVLSRWLAPREDSLRVDALGLTFPSPLGVAAGVDKNASWFESLGVLGFGFVEVGTVTALPQEGNPAPRVVRLTDDKALLNRMGFPNPGADVIADRLRRRTGRVIVGTNIGKSKLAPMETVGEDYRASARATAPYSDYMVVNVSSPNTQGLRDLQATALLRTLIADIRSELDAAGIQVPILIKIAPDLSDIEVDSIADLALELNLDGIVAINTTVDRSGLRDSNDVAGSIEGGGVSGAPLKARALAVLKRLRERSGDKLVLVSVGGIETPADAWERILAGATLLEANTGFVYQGPGWPKQMNRALARRVRDAGCTSIQQLVGTGGSFQARDTGPTDGYAPGLSTFAGSTAKPGGGATDVARPAHIA